MSALVVTLIAACVATPITQAEALTLAALVPDAIVSSQEGDKVLIQWGELDGPDGMAPGKYDVRVYGATTSEGVSSLIGYYAVDPRSAAVTYAMPDFDHKPLHDLALSRAQAALRRKHCLK